MLLRLKQYCQDLEVEQSDNILCAVSGGIDSIVMLHALSMSGYNCTIAHCNFHLRGEESDADEAFVRKTSAQLELNIICKDFDTYSYSKKNNISIQMAARELRYSWFEKMRQMHNCKYIAIAHNADDVVETMILNLARGTGITGLAGMKAKNGLIIRPILWAQRKEIEIFAHSHNISNREDSSNALTKYKRNKIRHQIIPLLKEINPSFMATMINNSKHFREIQNYITNEVMDCPVYYIDQSKDIYAIDIKDLCTENSKIIFVEYLKSKGIPTRIAKESIKLIDSEIGKSIIFKEYIFTKDKNKIIIGDIYNKFTSEIEISENCSNIETPLKLEFSIIEPIENFEIDKNKKAANLDYDKLKFPLKIRRWKTGDKFMPLGMNKFKKLSSFFIDNQFSILEKENTYVLCSDENIIWVIGHRIDDRFKISHKTKRCFKALKLK